jgi:hypothetical protein
MEVEKEIGVWWASGGYLKFSRPAAGKLKNDPADLRSNT